MTKLFLIYVVVINVLAYSMMCYDKRQAINKHQRIPESKLFLVAFLLGAPGIYLGMKAPVYHKSAKWQFKIGIPVLILSNVFLIYFMEIYIF